MTMKRLLVVSACVAVFASTLGATAASADPAPGCEISISNVRLADAMAHVQPKTANSLVFSWTGTAARCTNPISVSAELRQVGDPSSVEGLVNRALELKGSTVFDALGAGRSYIVTVTATDGTVSASSSSSPTSTLRGVADTVQFTNGTKAGARPGSIQIAGVATDSGYPIGARPVTLWVAPFGTAAAKQVASTTTDFAGAFNFWLHVTSNSRVTVKVDGVSTPTRIITIAYRVSVRATTATIRTNRAAIITAGISPSRRVLVSLYRLNGKKWAIAARTYSSAAGVARFSVRPTRKTVYRIVVPTDIHNTTAAAAVVVSVRAR